MWLLGEIIIIIIITVVVVFIITHYPQIMERMPQIKSVFQKLVLFLASDSQDINRFLL